MSSFKRKVKDPSASSATSSSCNALPSPALVENGQRLLPSGVKPWAHTGCGLVSTGHRELDDILLGGLTLGSITCFLVDDYSVYADTLVAYGLAEGLSQAQPCCVMSDSNSPSTERVLDILPFNLSYEKANPQSNEAEKQTLGNQSDHGLRIAWQYQKYLTVSQSAPPVSHTSSAQLGFCASFDLSRPLQRSLVADRLQVCSYQQSLSETLKFVRHFVESHSVCRVVLLHVEDLFRAAPRGSAGVMLARFLLSLRQLLSARPSCAVTLTLSPSQSPHLAQAVLGVCDAVLQVDSFAGRAETVPQEYSSQYLGFCALRVLRRDGLGAVPVPRDSRHGLQRDRRKLKISPLHLPPEDSRAMQSSNSILSGAPAATAAHVSAAPAAAPAAAIRGDAGHQHGHSHSHQHGHHHVTLQLETPPSTPSSTSSSTSSSSQAPSHSAQTNPESGRGSGLAASLAQARLQRQQRAQTQTQTQTPPEDPDSGHLRSIQPVSIAGRRSATQPSLDF